jgi:hypothetical protein
MISVKSIREILQERRKNKVRNIPDSYFDGGRRLADSVNQIVGKHCYNCKNAVAYVTWHCDVDECDWQPCYSRDQITKADYEAGNRLSMGWIELPPQVIDNQKVAG